MFERGHPTRAECQRGRNFYDPCHTRELNVNYTNFGVFTIERLAEFASREWSKTPGDLPISCPRLGFLAAPEMFNEFFNTSR